MASSSIQHVVFQNDPLEQKKFVNKYVQIHQTNGKTILGTVFTIDPVSERSVLFLQKSYIKPTYMLMA